MRPSRTAGDGDTLYHNNGNGTFTDVTKKAGVSDPGWLLRDGFICSDFDGDGLVDIYVANDSTPNFLYHNNGDALLRRLDLRLGRQSTKTAVSREVWGDGGRL